METDSHNQRHESYRGTCLTVTTATGHAGGVGGHHHRLSEIGCWCCGAMVQLGWLFCPLRHTQIGLLVFSLPWWGGNTADLSRKDETDWKLEIITRSLTGNMQFDYMTAMSEFMTKSFFCITIAHVFWMLYILCEVPHLSKVWTNYMMMTSLNIYN